MKSNARLTASTLRRRCIHAALILTVAAVSSGSAARAGDGLCGKWEGRWKSCTDGLEGTVKAKITKCGPGCYEAVFTGRAFKIMPYRYKVTLRACCDAETGSVRFWCSRKLPFWGQYRMRGFADGCRFRARYNTDDHVGYFVMRRVCDR